MIATEKITVTVTGADGAAVGNAQTPHPVNGEFLAVYVDYTNMPSTCDLTITTPNAPIKTLLTLTDANTDGWFYPRYIQHSEAGVALTGTAGGDRAKHPINDYIKAAVAQGNAGSVDLYFLVER